MPHPLRIETSLHATKNLVHAAKRLTRASGADDSQRMAALRIYDLLTPEALQRYARFMADTYDLVYVTDEQQGPKEALRKAVKSIRPDMDPDAYLQRWAFTLGNLVWLPFSLERPESKPLWPLYWQFITIAHETVHRVQCKTHEMAPFAWDYLTNEESRGQYEYEAYRVALELYPAIMGGAQLDPATLAEPLVQYGLSPSTIAFVVQQLTIVQQIIRNGGIVSEVSQRTLRWFADNL